MAMTSAKSKHFNPRSLDAINFLLADARGALGPYLNVFLVTQQHWSQSQVGLVTTISGLLGLAVQTPIGAVTPSAFIVFFLQMPETRRTGNGIAAVLSPLLARRVIRDSRNRVVAIGAQRTKKRVGNDPLCSDCDVALSLWGEPLAR
ncbi:MAG: hypothetical protein WBD95_22760 [Xanthobacteraceae bacterium]